jgi:UDP-N-acetylmuramate dehydrogenase
VRDPRRLRTRTHDRFGDRVPARLAPLTTFKWGPADWLLDLNAVEDPRAAVVMAADYGIPLVALGGGSNVLVPDAGIRGSGDSSARRQRRALEKMACAPTAA